MGKIKHLILPSLLILCFASGIAIAQTIVRALQLSQDTTGAFSVDSNNGVYFPGHINTTTSIASPPTVAGTGTPTVSGTDTAGLVTMGTSATTAVVTFARAYLTVPFCVVTWQSGLATTAVSYTLLTTSISLAQPATSANKINYMCMANS